MPPRFIEELKESIQTSIPTDSTIIGKVIQTIYSSGSSANDLAQIIERDPPLTAKILKAANSAYYGSATTINSLRRAVVVLGFDTIKELVSAVSVSHFFFDSSPKSGGIDRKGLWIHSVGVAKAAQIISNRVGVGRADVAYTVGLLHDIGKIVLTILYPEFYKRVVATAAAKRCRIVLAEQRLLNTDHAMVGKVLCELWNLPDDITSTVFSHHDPSEISTGDVQLIRLVHLSDILARTLSIGDPGDSVVPEPSRAALSLLGSTQERITMNFQTCLADLEKSKPEIDGFFSDLNRTAVEQN